MRNGKIVLSALQFQTWEISVLFLHKTLIRSGVNSSCLLDITLALWNKCLLIVLAVCSAPFWICLSFQLLILWNCHAPRHLGELLRPEGFTRVPSSPSASFCLSPFPPGSSATRPGSLVCMLGCCFCNCWCPFWFLSQHCNCLFL